MNSTSYYDEALLEACTAAAREQFTERELDEATTRLRDRLPYAHAAGATGRNASGRLPRWLRLSGALASVAMTVMVLSLLLPGRTGSTAFAQAQAWFESYQTLQLQLITRQGERELYRMTVWHQRGGATRIDVPPITQLVDPVRGELIVVMPEGQLMRQDLPLSRLPLGGREELAWLDELRQFQGEAELLSESLELDGVAAEGWRLELSGMQHTLWVDPSDQRPLRLDGRLGGGVTMETRFSFDEILPEAVFDLPGVD